MDPHASPSAVTFYISASLGESLLYLTEDRQLKPWLAESYEVTDGGKTYTFHLRKGVRWHDGQPFSPADVKATFDRLLGADFKSPKCGASLDVVADCAAKCDATIKPGSAKVECEPGKLQGQCSAQCEGSCDVEGGAKCDGQCNGKCDAKVVGKCDGWGTIPRAGYSHAPRPLTCQEFSRRFAGDDVLPRGQLLL